MRHSIFASAAIFLLCCVFSAQSFAQQEEWTTYKNLNNPFAIAADGDKVWSGNELGLYRWNVPQSGEEATYESFTDIVGAHYFLNCSYIDGSIRWFGVEGLGLLKYDGETWTTYSAEDTGLTNNWIWDIDMDNTGALWIATSEGVNRFDGENWTSFTEDNSDILSSYAWRLDVDTNNNVWCGSWQGVSVYSIPSGTWQTFTTDNSDLPNNSVNDITTADDGVVWMTSSNGLTSYSNGTWQTFTIDNGLPSNELEKVRFAPNGQMWLTSYHDGAFTYNLSSSTVYNETNGLPDNSISDITFSADGTVWLAIREGIYGLKDGVWTILADPNGPISNYISKIAIDASGVKWIGTDSGLSRFDGTTWTHYTTADGLPEDGINDVTIDADGNIWVGTYGGAARFDGSAWTTFTEENSGLPTDYVYAIEFQAPSTIWFGTSVGLTSYNAIEWQSFDTNNSELPFNSISSITVHGSRVWIAGYPGAAEYDAISGNWNTYSTSNGLSNDYLGEIGVDLLNNYVWFGTMGNGVDRFDHTSWVNFGEADGLPDLNVPSVDVSPDNVKWFGSWHSGVTKYDGLTWESYNMDNSGIAGDDVRDVAFDIDGAKWFATNAGVSRLGSATVAEPPAAPTNPVASDVPDDHGHTLSLSWTLSADDATIDGYYIYRSRSSELTTVHDIDEYETVQALIDAEATTTIRIADLAAGTDSYVDPFVPLNGVDYYYWIVAYRGGVASKAAAFTGGPVGIETQTPLEFALKDVYPNPFNAETTIAFTLPATADAKIAIYSITGQKIRTLHNATLSAGSHTLRWDGRNDSGSMVSSGVYILTLNAGMHHAVTRMTFMK